MQGLNVPPAPACVPSDHSGFLSQSRWIRDPDLVLGANVSVYACVFYTLALLSPGNWSRFYPPLTLRHPGEAPELKTNRGPFGVAAVGAVFPMKLRLRYLSSRGRDGLVGRDST